ncbi:MAG: glycoside hydrolase family 10 protein [Xenococcaceae cyanobacterium]
MLANVRIFKRSGFELTIVSKVKLYIILNIIASIVPFGFWLSPATAAGETFGVVKSQENAKQWSEISNRLQQIGVNYCVVDTTKWQEEADLGNVSLLLLPNVENLNGAHALSLERWIKRGGKAIVTGPTGALSQPQVRTQLRSLLGSYWGFSLSSPTTLDPSVQMGSSRLAHTFVGGAIVPQGNNSETLAHWIAEGEPAAVVATNNVTSLGWRWGTDAVAPASFDSAWLETILVRYGMNTYRDSFSSSDSQPQLCNTGSLPDRELKPFVPRLQPSLENKQLKTKQLDNKQNFLPRLAMPVRGAQSLDEEGITPRLPNLDLPNTAIFTPAQIETMSRELEALIGRFESKLLTADANNSKIEISTNQVIEKVLEAQNRSNKSLVDNLPSSSSFSHKTSSHQALKEAKQQLEQFQQLAQKGDYEGARRQWMQARRNLWDRYPTDRQVSQAEIRAMWLDRGTIVQARSEADLAKVFDRMAAAGINTVFFETLNASYPIYPSQIAPEQNPLIKGWDPLASAVKLAHERGMELHAWVWMFAAANQRHNLKLNQPKDYLGPVLSAHPDWAGADNKSNIFEKSLAPKAFYDPANPAVRRYLLLVLEEIATRYQVDGIQLDYIRYPFQHPHINYSYGYGIASRQQFQGMTGVDPIELSPSHELWSQWNKFRIQQIDDVVALVSRRLKEKRPDLILSAAVFSMPRAERLTKIQQNWEEWVKNEWIDLLVPMTYASNTDELAQKAEPIFNKSSEGTTLFLPGIRLLNLPNFIAVDQMQLLRNSTVDGYALFAAENFNPSLEQIFNRTQGSAKISKPEPLPYRHPFKATASRFQSLQKEWNYLLANQQMKIEELDMKELGEQADELAESFDRLAKEPNKKNLTFASDRLTGFRKRFAFWMQEYGKTKPHQLKAWQNRLETLDRLLSYGGRIEIDGSRDRLAIK